MLCSEPSKNFTSGNSFLRLSETITFKWACSNNVCSSPCLHISAFFFYLALFPWITTSSYSLIHCNLVPLYLPFVCAKEVTHLGPLEIKFVCLRIKRMWCKKEGTEFCLRYFMNVRRLYGTTNSFCEWFNAKTLHFMCLQCSLSFVLKNRRDK